MNLIAKLLRLPRRTKKIIFLANDLVMFFFAFWFSVSLRLEIQHEIIRTDYWILIAVVTLASMMVFIRLGLYRAVIRFMGSKVMTTALLGSLISMLLLAFFSYLLQTPLPRSVPVMYFMLLLILLVSSRMAIRGLLQTSGTQTGLPVVIYGAGQSGRQLLEAMKQVNEYYPVAFVDDDASLHGRVIYNKMVYSPTRLPMLIEDYSVKKILLAIPSAPAVQKKEIIHKLEMLPCEVMAIPGMVDLVDGKVTVASLKKVSIGDLLGREPVEPDAQLLTANIQGKNVLVTGAGGSIGSELCRQILKSKPDSLILYEISEFALYSIYKELEELLHTYQLPIELYPLLGSVQNYSHLVEVMQRFEVHTIYHAAAYKHVPLVEFNTIAGVLNNVFGTLQCAQAAVQAEVDTFVLISTDKAVRPTNTMGATKRMAELVLQALAAQADQPTRFCMVRFGNVLGSSGSVIPLFERQIAKGGPVTVTHQEITRFFMTIPEASQLVIQAGAMGQGGDVFVLDMGNPIRIMDLARRMIHLSGLGVKNDTHKDGDIEIVVTGLRPGEKLYEELLISDNVKGSTHPRIMTAQEIMLPWEQLSPLLDRLIECCTNKDSIGVRAILEQAPLAFTPKDPVCDLTLKRQQESA